MAPEQRLWTNAERDLTSEAPHCVLASCPYARGWHVRALLLSKDWHNDPTGRSSQRGPTFRMAKAIRRDEP